MQHVTQSDWFGSVLAKVNVKCKYSIVFAGVVRQNALTSNATDIEVTNVMKNWSKYAY